MPKETKKSDYVRHSINGTFDSKTGISVLEKLRPKLEEASVPGTVLDFSEAAHITAGGMQALQWLTQQLGASGKRVVISGMRTEMYKALKVAGVSDALTFNHRTVTAGPPIRKS